MSNHAAGSSTPIPPPVTDIYRPTTAASQRELAPFLPPGTTPTTRPSLPEIFGIDEKTFSSRVGGKNILIDPSPTAGGSGAGVGGETKGLSDLVVGKKRHQGHPQALVKARRAAEYAQAQRDSVGAKGLRAVRRKLKRKERGGVVDKGIIEGITYQSLLPLHHLHLAYLAAMLNLTPRPTPSSTATSTPDTPQAPRQPVASSSTHPDPQLPLGLGAESIQSKILKADLTGSILSVLSSRNPSPIGIRGIVIEETASTFRLISRDNTIRVIPKNGTQFRISFPAYAPPPLAEAEQAQIAQGEPEPPIDWEKHRKTCPRIELEILGTAFGYRSADRAGRKFRPAQGGGGGSGWGEDWVQGEWSGVLGEVEGELARRAGESGRRVDSNGGRKGKGKGRKAGSGAGASESGHDARGEKKRKRGKSRRKDLPAWGRLDVP